MNHEITFTPVPSTSRIQYETVAFSVVPPIPGYAKGTLGNVIRETIHEDESYWTIFETDQCPIVNAARGTITEQAANGQLSGGEIDVFKAATGKPKDARQQREQQKYHNFVEAAFTRAVDPLGNLSLKFIFTC